MTITMRSGRSGGMSDNLTTVFTAAGGQSKGEGSHETDKKWSELPRAERSSAFHVSLLRARS